MLESRTVYHMTGGGLGGGVIFVIAALLWAAVLVPAWIRRREFRAAERNALRLQRTLRVLAETSEVPTEVRLEATAREALAHEKLLRSAQRRQEAERDAELAQERAAQVRAEIRAQQMERKQAAMQRAARLRRPVARRMRAVAALAATVGLVGSLVGAGFAIAGSGAGVLIGCGLLASIGVGTLVLLAPGRARIQPIAAEIVDTAPIAIIAAAHEEDEEEELAGVEAAAAAHAAAQQAAALRIERARARSRARAVQKTAVMENQADSILLREAREQVTRARGEQSAVAASRSREQDREAAQARAAEAAIEASVRRKAESNEQVDRLRQMGVVGDTTDGLPDLDAVFRRRSAS